MASLIFSLADLVTLFYIDKGHKNIIARKLETKSSLAAYLRKFSFAVVNLRRKRNVARTSATCGGQEEQLSLVLNTVHELKGTDKEIIRAGGGGGGGLRREVWYVHLLCPERPREHSVHSEVTPPSEIYLQLNKL